MATSALPNNKNHNDSPCIRNCCLDDHKICMGCGRSLPEILEWHRADDVRQAQIIDKAKTRLLDHPNATFKAG